MAEVKPSFRASFNLFSVWLTGRSAPERLISPKTTVSGASGVPSRADRSAAATARSAAGSEIFSPPATFR
jgi:hypothetical protein